MYVNIQTVIRMIKLNFQSCQPTNDILFCINVLIFFLLSNFHKCLAMVAATNASRVHTISDGTPRPLKITQQGG